MFSLRIITVASTLLLMSSQMTGAAAEPMPATEYEWYDWRNLYSFTVRQESWPVPTLVYTQTEPDYSSIVLAENDTALLNYTASASWPNLPPGSICACITTDSGTPLDPPVVISPGVSPIISAAIPEPASALLILLGWLGILASRKRFVN